MSSSSGVERFVAAVADCSLGLPEHATTNEIQRATLIDALLALHRHPVRCLYIYVFYYIFLSYKYIKIIQFRVNLFSFLSGKNIIYIIF
jgi:hypothetical protein